MSKKLWGAALMGLGQGASFYGNLLARDELSAREDARIRSRQESLQELSQRFQREMEGSRRTWEKSRDWHNYNRERYNKMEELDPTSKVGGLMESASERELQRQIRLRETPYGGRGADILSNFNPNNYTPASVQEFMTHVRELQSGGMDGEDALAQAYAEHGDVLELKQSASGTDATLVRSAIDAKNKFFEMYPETQAELVARITGRPEEELLGMTPTELWDLYRRAMYGDMPDPSEFFNSKGIMPGSVDPFGDLPSDPAEMGNQ